MFKKTHLLFSFPLVCGGRILTRILLGNWNNKEVLGWRWGSVREQVVSLLCSGLEKFLFLGDYWLKYFPRQPELSPWLFLPPLANQLNSTFVKSHSPRFRVESSSWVNHTKFLFVVVFLFVPRMRASCSESIITGFLFRFDLIIQGALHSPSEVASAWPGATEVFLFGLQRAGANGILWVGWVSGILNVACSMTCKGDPSTWIFFSSVIYPCNRKYLMVLAR